MEHEYVSALGDIVSQLEAMEKRFIRGSSETYLSSEDQAKFVGLMTEAKAMMASVIALGAFGTQLVITVNNGIGGFFGGPSLQCVQECRQIVEAAIRQLKRATFGQSVNIQPSASKAQFVDPKRMAQLEGLTAQNKQWDFSKLVRLCGELNYANRHDCFYSVAMLSRAIADHVPPVFGHQTFAQVAANSPKSLKDTFDHLDRGLRKIADGFLHQHIRRTETVPTATQVDFRQYVDLLLGEVIRVASASETRS